MNWVERYFTRERTSQLGGIGIDVIAEENAARHADAYPVLGFLRPTERYVTEGEYQWRREGSPHLFDPEAVFRLQHATRSKRVDIFQDYTARVNDQSKRLDDFTGFIRVQLRARAHFDQDVESIESIVKRFSTGAMSYGSISAEAHETLAIAMNRIGAKSNTGEGGEDSERFLPMPNGDLKTISDQGR